MRHAWATVSIRKFVLRIHMKKITLSFFLFLVVNLTIGQITFEKRIGANAHGSSIIQTPDSGYIVSGFSFSKMTLLKIDAYGNVIWRKNYDNVADDIALDSKDIPSGGFVLAGFTEDTVLGNEDACLIKADSVGNIIWKKAYGVPAHEHDRISSFDKTFDNGYIAAGYTLDGGGNMNATLFKTDSAGDTLWTKIFGGGIGNPAGWADCVQTTSDSGYIMVGTTFNFGAGNADVYLIKTNQNGDTLWTRTYGGLSRDEGLSVVQTSNGGYMIVGTSDSFGAGGYDVYIVKTDSLGNIIWSKAYGGNGYDFGNSIKKTNDGGFIIGGETQSFPAGNYQFYLLKIDSLGSIMWATSFGSNGIETGNYALETMDGGYIMTGYGLFIIKTDSTGNSSCFGYNTTTSVNNCNTQVNNTSTIITSANLIVSSPPLNVIDSAFYVYDACDTTLGIAAINSSVLTLYPNPFTDEIIIKSNEASNGEKEIILFDVTGKEVLSTKTFDTEIKLNTSIVTKGFYLLRYTDKKNTSHLTLVKL